MITICFFFPDKPYTEKSYPITTVGFLMAELSMHDHLATDKNNSCLATVGNKSQLITSVKQLLING